MTWSTATLGSLGLIIATTDCSPFPQRATIQGPSILVQPQTLAIPTGTLGTVTVALSDDPEGQVVLNVACIGGGCGFAVLGTPSLYFDSSNFDQPQTVTLVDTGFKGR